MTFIADKSKIRNSTHKFDQEESVLFWVAWDGGYPSSYLLGNTQENHFYGKMILLLTIYMVMETWKKNDDFDLRRWTIILYFECDFVSIKLLVDAHVNSRQLLYIKCDPQKAFCLQFVMQMAI